MGVYPYRSAYHCVGWHAVVCYGAPEWFRQWTVTADTFTGHYQLKLEDKFGFRFTNSHYDTPEDDYAYNVRGWTRSRDRLAQSANNDDDGGGVTPANVRRYACQELAGCRSCR